MGILGGLFTLTEHPSGGSEAKIHLCARILILEPPKV